MRPAIYLVVAAASLCAGCQETEPAAPNDARSAVQATGPDDARNPIQITTPHQLKVPGQSRGFFGIPLGDGARKVVYVSDRSGSMTDSIDYVKFELRRSIGELDEGDQFHVLFFSSSLSPPVEMPTRRLANATRRIKALAGEFIDGIIPQGQTDPVESIKRAFAMRPDVIFLLTDGEFDRSVVDLTKRLNVGGKVTVHTIGFLYRGGEEVLKQIAEQNNGNYVFVSEADLAAMLPG